MNDQLTLEIEGREVSVDRSFLQLSDAEKEETVNEIAESMGVAPGKAGSSVLRDLDRGITAVTSQVYRGISESVGGLVDSINPFDSPHWLNPFPEGTGSAKNGLSNLMRAAGIAVAEGAPETPGQAFAQGVGEAVGALIPMGATLQAGRTAGGLVGNLSDDAMRALSTRTGMAAEATAGGLSAAAEKAAADAGAPAWAQGVAAVAAPMGAFGTLAAARNTPLAMAGRKAKAALAPYTRAGAMEVARKRMQTLAGGSERSDEIAARVTQDNPLNLTPAQQTGDQNMLALERLAADQDPTLRDGLTARRAESETLAAETIDAGGNVADAQAFFAQRRQAFKQDLQARADRAVADSEGKIRQIESTRLDEDSSVAATNGVRAEFDKARETETELWARVDRDAVAGTTQAKAVAEKWSAELGRARADDMPQVVKNLLLDEGGFGEEETVREVYNLYSKLREVARHAKAGTNQRNTLARVANEVADALLADLGAKNGTTAVGRQINEARAYSAAMHETFDQGAPAKILRRTLAGDTAIEPELALSRTVKPGGIEGAVASRQLEGAGVNSDIIEDYVAGQFAKSAVSPDTGEITLGQARRFMAKNRALLERYPGLKIDIESAVKNGETAKQFSERIASRLATLENERRSAAAAFMGAEPERAIDAVFKAKNSAQAARRVANEARKDETGAALAGVKSAFTNNLMAKASTVRDGRSIISGDAFLRVLADPQTRRVVSQIFSSQEIDRMRRIGGQLAFIDARAPDIGGSLSGAKAPKLVEFIARIVAARQGAELGGSGGGSIQTASMASERVKNTLSRLTNDRASQILADAVTDPDLFRVLLTDPIKGARQEEAISRLIPYLVGAAATSGE